ncbi:putative Ig domain-containing protein [Kitasatospora sp. NPDC059571]|uniref:putative Ig domain-containing protein n=1 Tax=Kitasatospora sp. NPDC059571 TaxID=3346871 RepID=UPI0036895D00
MGIPRTGSAARTALTGLASLSLLGGALLATAATQAAAATATEQSSSSSVANPYSPAYQHPYRHGVVPTIQQHAKMQDWAAGHPALNAATGPQTLSYGGGIDGIGVQSGHSKVYLVFYGTQWGTQTTDANGNAKFSGDSAGAAGAAQQMFKGIGTGNELWSADLTQWCDGPNVAAGATSCPSNANFVPYQSGGVLSGVWYDNAAASPSAASGHQLGQEAVNAAAHFGNTTAASNRDAYYVILSPHGTNPDNYQNQYCAWHDYNGDTTLTGGAVTSPYGDIAFSNQPYNIDSGAGCGVGFVNSPGTLDGWTMTLGHEWHEMMSDQNPAGGWTNHTGSSYDGQENSDECAWLSPGTTGGAANIAFGSFGTWAEQASWSNDTNSCAISHPIVGGGSTGNTVTVTNPGSQSGTVGTAASLQISASDSASGQTLTYSATGLPAGLSINSATGLISGTPTTAGTSSVTVTAKDTTNATGSTSFSWTESTTGGGCTARQLLGNPGFETGTAAPWTASTGVVDNSSSEAAHSGSWKAWLNGYGSTHTDTLSQAVSIPAGCKATLTFWLHIDTAETTTTTAYDKLTLQAGTTTLATYSNLNKNTGYVQKTVDLSAYAGQSVTVKFTGTEDSSLQTSFVIDDTALNVS